jgi:hypothetical protein
MKQPLINTLRTSLALALMAALPVQAAPILVTGWASPGPTAVVRISNTVSAIDSRVYAGAFATTESGSNTFASWCIDIFQRTQIGTTVTNFSQVTGEAYFGTQTARFDQLGQLATLAYADALSSATHAAAFQLAIWEITNESSGTLNVGGGSFKASNANDTMVLAQSWLDALPDESLYGFNVWASSTHQDLVVFAALPPRLPQPAQGVPEPGSLALAALGFGALFAARRRKSFSAAV